MGRKRKGGRDADEQDFEAPPRAPRSKKGARGGEHSALGTRWREVARGFLFGKEVDEATSTRMREIGGIAMVGAAAFLFLALASYATPFDDPANRNWNWGGQVGFYLANGVKIVLGNAGYFGVFLAGAWGLVMIGGRSISFVSLRVFGAVLFLFSFAFLLQHIAGPAAADVGQSYDSRVAPYGPGGWLALTWNPFLVEKFGNLGLFLLLVLTALVSFLLATEIAFLSVMQSFGAWLEKRRELRGESLPSAVFGYLRSTATGLWAFLRGADLRGTLALDGGAVVLDDPEALAEARPKRRSRAKKEPDPDNPEGLPVLDEDELEDDFEEELEEDEEYGEELDEAALAVLEAEERAAAGLGDADPDDDVEESDEAALDDEEGAVLVPPAAAQPKPPPVKAKVAQMVFDPPTPPPGPWQFPPLDLLLPPEGNLGVDDSALEEAAAKLENALRSFRVDAQVVSAQVGPSVTLFELSVAQGTRMNKVSTLSQEIAAALRAQSVRVIAPIPGRDTIGVEVPNTKRRVVRISELVSQKAYDPKYMGLPLFVGMDAEGRPIVEDLARMPHLLIAGTTGSGKSVCINTILASLLLTRSPHDVKLILIDPKMVELQAFATVPHMMCPVVTDARQATGVLLWAVEKMEGRYELFRSAAVKNVKGYNALGEEGLRKALGDDFDPERTPRHLPYIVVVIDEFADLMAVSKKEAELAITRLAQKSRAAGIHVIVATQRPSTDVITGVIKGNLPTRIAFQVASRVDSRVILDETGADKLLGHGDMLFMPPGGGKLKRVQGALVEDSEITKLVDFVGQTSAPSFSQELIQVATGETRPTGGGIVDGEAEEDPMFDEAVRVVLKTKRGSASLLQRAMGVGYTRASRLIDLMSERGILGPHKGSKVRDILVTLDQWEEMHGPSPAGSGGASERAGAANDE
jgi:S-DNA-T family DNA segregation ATPase FtsK/SpoIIIE